MNKLNLADNIIRLRHEKKLTQEELADFMGVTKASVSKWEKGINTPDLMLLPQLATYFGVTIDELVGYEAQLSNEQIRRQYADLSKDFATRPFAEVLEKVRSLAHKYYACYPFLLQLGVLYQNHYMLAKTEEERRAILQEAVGWCDRIVENCRDVDICGDAVVLRAGLYLMLGQAAEAVEALEPSADPSHFAGKNGTMLVQAYRLAGDTEKAKSYVQVKHYMDLLELAADAVLTLSLYEDDPEYCEETIRRMTGIIKLYHLETLHPNVAAQFYFQSAASYAASGKEDEALEALRCFEKCVEALLGAERIELHGDGYFHLLDAWIDRLPLGNMAPRDKSFIRKNLEEAFAHPAFASMRNAKEFQRLYDRLTKGGVSNA